MSLALSSRGLIPDDVYQPLARRGCENTGVCRATRGMVTQVGFAAVTPGYNLEESVGFDDVIITTYPNGTEQRIGGAGGQRRQFNLVFPLIGSADADNLWNFYISRRGPLYAFYFTSPRDGSRCLVRFASKSLTRTLFSYLLESTGISLIEVVGE